MKTYIVTQMKISYTKLGYYFFLNAECDIQLSTSFLGRTESYVLGTIRMSTCPFSGSYYTCKVTPQCIRKAAAITC